MKRPLSRGLRVATLLAALLGSACAAPSAHVPWELVQRHPHDPESFTQGLELYRDRLYESSGRYGRSWVEYRPAPGREHGGEHRRRQLPAQWFAEGLTLLDDELWLLTWREGLVVVLDPDTLTTRRSHRHDGEGWGLTRDDGLLVLSDGSSTLRFLEPGEFVECRRVTVRESGRPVSRLNELETVGGWLLANVWLSDAVVVIHPDSGEVVRRLDLAELYPRALRSPEADVLNGLAWDEEDGSLLVTGKLWPEMYRLRLELPPPPKRSPQPCPH